MALWRTGAAPGQLGIRLCCVPRCACAAHTYRAGAGACAPPVVAPAISAGRPAAAWLPAARAAPPARARPPFNCPTCTRSFAAWRRRCTQSESTYETLLCADVAGVVCAASLPWIAVTYYAFSGERPFNLLPGPSARSAAALNAQHLVKRKFAQLARLTRLSSARPRPLPESAPLLLFFGALHMASTIAG